MIAVVKLLVLVPLLWFICVIIAGHSWPVAMVLALVAGGFWFKMDQAQKRRRALYQQQVVDTRNKMIAAQQEAERAQQKADIEEAVRRGVESGVIRPDKITKQWFQGGGVN